MEEKNYWKLRKIIRKRKKEKIVVKDWWRMEKHILEKTKRKWYILLEIYYDLKLE